MCTIRHIHYDFYIPLAVPTLMTFYHLWILILHTRFISLTLMEDDNPTACDGHYYCEFHCIHYNRDGV